LHRGWRLECGVGGSGHPRSQTSHRVILNGIIVKNAVSWCCFFFWESGRVNPISSPDTIGTILNLDVKTVWTYWDMFQRFGPENGQAGRPLWHSSKHLDLAIGDIFARFPAREPTTSTPVTSFVLEQFHIPIIPDTLSQCYFVMDDSERPSASRRNLIALTSRLKRSAPVCLNRRWIVWSHSYSRVASTSRSGGRGTLGRVCIHLMPHTVTAIWLTILVLSWMIGSTDVVALKIGKRSVDTFSSVDIFLAGLSIFRTLSHCTSLL
jgi:hypothetical protein